MLASRFPFKRFCKRLKDALVSRPLVPEHEGPRQEENGKDQAAWQVSPRLSLAAVIVGALRYTVCLSEGGICQHVLCFKQCCFACPCSACYNGALAKILGIGNNSSAVLTAACSGIQILL